MFFHQNYAAGGENGSIMVGMFVCLCLASQTKSFAKRLPSGSFSFLPAARTDYGLSC